MALAIVIRTRNPGLANSRGRVQPEVVPRATLSPAQVFIRVLLALAVILNGTAVPAMASAMATQDAGMHAEHHGPGGTPGEA
ncbi:MAG: hypothetical protein ACRES3_07110, partial [Steroidobacteraceae bacterium]